MLRTMVVRPYVGSGVSGLGSGQTSADQAPDPKPNVPTAMQLIMEVMQMITIV